MFTKSLPIPRPCLTHPVHGLLQNALGVVEFSLRHVRCRLAVQQQRRRVELVRELLEYVEGVLQLVSALCQEVHIVCQHKVRSFFKIPLATQEHLNVQPLPLPS